MSRGLPIKDKFHLIPGVTYMDGNSLGLLAKGLDDRVSAMIRDEWGGMAIQGWNRAHWMDQPARVGDQLGRLIGASEGSVVLGDTLSIKVYQALAAALQMQTSRKEVLSDTGNFPTDLYMAEGLIDTLNDGHTLKLVEPEMVEQTISEKTAVVLLTQVDYRTGRLHDMESVTRKAHEAGAVVIWDLAHSAGALPIDLQSCNCEFAVGCTYKYLNGGPGAPAFIYVRPDIVDSVKPALSGWLGHALPFAFEPTYKPAGGIERMRVGTPPVIQMSALEYTLDLWDELDMQAVREKSIELSELFIKGVETSCTELSLVSPRDPQKRGSQISFSYEHGYAAMQALIANGVVGDFRAPDIMRFGITPLYLDEADILKAVEVLSVVLSEQLWKKPEFQLMSRVT